jgi:hypothetical protein
MQGRLMADKRPSADVAGAEVIPVVEEFLAQTQR